MAELLCRSDLVGEAQRRGLAAHGGKCAQADLDRAHALADRINAGTVWVNTYGPTDTRLPWGGMDGESGIGRDLGGSPRA